MSAEKDLLRAAAEIRDANINGWGNACEAGADRIRDLEAAVDKRSRRARQFETALRHVRASAQGRDVGVVISYAAFERVRAALTETADGEVNV